MRRIFNSFFLILFLAGCALLGLWLGAVGRAKADMVLYQQEAFSRIVKNGTPTLVPNYPIDGATLTNATFQQLNQVIATSSGGQASSSFIAQANGSPGYAFNSTGGATDQKWMDCFLNTTTYACRFVNDANSVANAFFTVSRGAGPAVGGISFGAGGGTQTLPNTTGTLARTSGDTLTSTTLTAPTITGTVAGGGTYSSVVLSSPQITGALVSGSGYATGSVGNCGVGGGVGAACANTITWSTTLSSSTYAAFCSAENTNVESGIGKMSSKTTTSMQVDSVNFSASALTAASGTIRCIALP